MTEKTIQELERGYDVFVCAAAIADYTPDEVAGGKIKSGRRLTLKLKPTRKLTKLARDSFKDLFVVGFKAEYNVSEDELTASAVRKLEGERLDLIVANDVGRNRFGSDETSVVFVKGSKAVGRKSGRKADVARKLLDLIEEYA
jgi:phosphopantothenoylcysteine decarboxylase/phosphopantothenate--cysteine ligase